MWHYLNGSGGNTTGNVAPAGTYSAGFDSIAALTIDSSEDFGSSVNNPVAFGMMGPGLSEATIQEYDNGVDDKAVVKTIRGNAATLPSGGDIFPNGDFLLVAQFNDVMYRYSKNWTTGDGPITTINPTSPSGVSQSPNKVSINTNTSSGVTWAAVSISPNRGFTTKAIYIWQASHLSGTGVNTPDYVLTSSSFSNPVGVGIDNESNIYVSDATNNQVYEFDSSGNIPPHGSQTPTQTYTSSTFNTPAAIYAGHPVAPL
jgi:hypothetical protein